MKKYENLSIKIVNVAVKDVITTSGFDGWEQDFETPKSGNAVNVPDSMV